MLWQLVFSLLAAFTNNDQAHIESGIPVPPVQLPPEVGPQTPEEIAQASAGLQGEHYGGDMLHREGEAHPSDGDGIRDIRYRWLNYPGSGVVPYTIDPNLDNLRGIIQESMEEYHRTTCIRFVPKNNSHRDWIDLRYGTGCNSYVGRQGGRQVVNLGDGCWFKGTVIHELGHAIGMHHEHQRSDRDNYIYVYKQNVVPQFAFAFDRTNHTEELLLTQYDYDSIMHYGNYAFSKQPDRLPTMAAYNGKQLLEPYHKPGFTGLDIQAVRSLYKCR